MSEGPAPSQVWSSCATLEDGIAHVANQSATPVDEEAALLQQLKEFSGRL